jgi:catecholate siderophore receptor
MTKKTRRIIVLLLVASVPFIGLTTAASAQTPSTTAEKDSARPPEKQTQTLAPVRIDARARDTRYNASYSRTATKTTELARNVPQSMTIVTSALVRDQGMQSMADVVRYVPGVTMGQGEGNRDQPTIRGNSTSADFFVDGARDDAQYFRDLYNLERVEALKGSNAMVFGRGGGGGVLNRVTKQAEWVSKREVTGEAGSFGGRRVSTDLQQRISPFASARLNTVYENSELFRDRSSLERSGINPTATFSTLSRATTVSAGYEHFLDSRTADRGVPSFQGRPVDTDPSTFFGNPDESHARVTVNSANATITHDAGVVQIRNNTRFANYNKFYQNIFSGAVTAAGDQVNLTAYNHGIERRSILNQTDVTWSASTGGMRHDLLAGAEIGRESTSSIRNTGYFGDATTTLVPLSNPMTSVSVAFRQSATDADNATVVNTSSMYVQDQLTVSPRVRFIGGVRYERFDIAFSDHRADAERDRDDGMISPRAGFVVKPTDLVSFYGSYSMSFLPGSGDQFSSLTEATKGLEPERFTNYETGIKWDVLDRLALSASAYRLDRNNTRAADPTDPTKLVQTGAQRSQGIELGASGRVTSGWDIAAALARQEATIIRQTTSSPAGASVPLVPNTTISLWNKVSIAPRYAISLGAVRQARMFAAIDNKVVLPAFTRFDGGLYAGLGMGLTAQVNVENIFNVRYFPTANSNNNISPGAPRNARLILTAAF